MAAVGGHAQGQDLVITTALIPGRPAPRLLSADAVRAMHPGSVIVDLAAETGGNCELTRPGETVTERGVSILGPLNLAASVPLHASQMYGRNVLTFVTYLLKEGALRLDLADPIAGPMCVTHGGELRTAKAA